jgi:hypothetical protein
MQLAIKPVNEIFTIIGHPCFRLLAFATIACRRDSFMERLTVWSGL